MDRFSELVAHGVNLFVHTPIAPEIPIACPVCRVYNNIYSMINNTHMSPLDNGAYVITGKAVADMEEFEKFLFCNVYKCVDIRRYGSPNEFFARNQLKGHFDTLNGDMVYILEYDESTLPQPSSQQTAQ